MESSYADDVDFLCPDMQELASMFDIIERVLKEWNLSVNQEKTEYVKFDKSNHETWKFHKVLGSLIDSSKDIENRIILANIAFAKFKKLWMDSNILLERKLNIYEAQVISILLYNSSSWAAPKSMLDKVETCHRRHLRTILNIKYPKVISNESLYTVTNVKPLTKRIEKSRWTMLGHILRSDELTPAHCALVFAINAASQLKGRKGRHNITLFSTIKADIESRGLTLKNIVDFYNLKDIADNKARWNAIV